MSDHHSSHHHKHGQCCGHKHHCHTEQDAPKEEAEVLDNTEAKEEMTLSAAELLRLSNESQEYKDKYLRLLAEMENMKKRMQKERQDISRYAAESIILDILQPLDQFEMALDMAENMTPEVKNWAIGFNMILGQLKNVLSNHNVSYFSSIGTVFDPHLHEAVEMIESETHEPGIIIKELTKGYKIGDRLLRAARVQVSKEKSSKE